MKTTEKKKKEFLERANKILYEILEASEFKEIKKQVLITWFPINASNFWKIVWSNADLEAVWFNPKKNAEVLPHRVNQEYIQDLEKVEIIALNPFTEHLFNFSDEDIKELIRHELLHIELQKGQDDVGFVKEALKRNISIHSDDVIKNIAHLEDLDVERAWKYFSKEISKIKR